jgi:hypothetical protein
VINTDALRRSTGAWACVVNGPACEKVLAVCRVHVWTRHRRRIPLRNNAFHPLLPEHGIGDRCCCTVSVNARQA